MWGFLDFYFGAVQPHKLLYRLMITFQYLSQILSDKHTFSFVKCVCAKLESAKDFMVHVKPLNVALQH